MQITRRTLIKKIMQGIDEQGWAVIDRKHQGGSFNQMVEPLMQYLNRIGVTVVGNKKKSKQG
jgi:hypothetical protein